MKKRISIEFINDLFLTGFLIFENTLMGALVMNAAIGMVRSWLLVPQPLVIIEDISIDKFASAYGIFAVVNGIVSIFVGPFIGTLFSQFFWSFFSYWYIFIMIRSKCIIILQ